jgi:hypothetical protein
MAAAIHRAADTEACLDLVAGSQELREKGGGFIGIIDRFWPFSAAHDRQKPPPERHLGPESVAAKQPFDDAKNLLPLNHISRVGLPVQSTSRAAIA